MRRYLLGLLLLACSEPAATGEPQFASLDWCDYHRCEVAGTRVFTPEPKIAVVAGHDINRWAAATGLDLSIGEDGIPIRFVSDVWEENPDNPGEFWPLCGRTLFTWGPNGQTQVDAIEIDSSPPDGCIPIEQILLHELGHALAGNTLHTTRGVMKLTASENGLDDEAISLICNYAPCTKFAPERYLRAVQ